MDGCLWSVLDDDMIKNIFARLPWICILRLRCLSKYWSSFLCSGELQRLQQAVPSQMFRLVGIDEDVQGRLQPLPDNVAASARASLGMHDDLPLFLYFMVTNIWHEDITVASGKVEGRALLAIFVRRERVVNPVICNKVLFGTHLSSLFCNMRGPILDLDLFSYWRSDFCSATRVFVKMEIDSATNDYKIFLEIRSIRTLDSSENQFQNHVFSDIQVYNDALIQQYFEGPPPSPGNVKKFFQLIRAGLAFLIFDLGQNAQRLIRFPPGSTESNYICIAWNSSDDEQECA